MEAQCRKKEADEGSGSNPNRERLDEIEASLQADTQALSELRLGLFGGLTGSGKTSRRVGALFEAFPETSHGGAAIVLQKDCCEHTCLQ